MRRRHAQPRQHDLRPLGLEVRVQEAQQPLLQRGEVGGGDFVKVLGHLRVLEWMRFCLWLPKGKMYLYDDCVRPEELDLGGLIHVDQFERKLPRRRRGLCRREPRVS